MYQPWVLQSKTTRMPDIKFIFCHGGGVMPILLGRMQGFSGWRGVGPERMKAMFPNGVYSEFSKLYFECAQAYAPEAFSLVRKVVKPDHILFGTDYSYFNVSHAVGQFKALDIPDDLRTKIAGTMLQRFCHAGKPEVRCGLVKRSLALFTLLTRCTLALKL